MQRNIITPATIKKRLKERFNTITEFGKHNWVIMCISAIVIAAVLTIVSVLGADAVPFSIEVDDIAETGYITNIDDVSEPVAVDIIPSAPPVDTKTDAHKIEPLAREVSADNITPELTQYQQLWQSINNTGDSVSMVMTWFDNRTTVLLREQDRQIWTMKSRDLSEAGDRIINKLSPAFSLEEDVITMSFTTTPKIYYLFEDGTGYFRNPDGTNSEVFTWEFAINQELLMDHMQQMDWRRLYHRYIESQHWYDDFILADLNFDGLPEMLIVGPGCATASLAILTITRSGIEVIYHGGFGGLYLYRRIDDGSLTYVLRNCNSYYGITFMTNKTTQIDRNFRTSARAATWSWTMYWNDELETMEYFYTINGEAVSRQEYERLIDDLTIGYEKVPYTINHWSSWAWYTSDRSTLELEAEILEFLNSFKPIDMPI